MLSKWERAIAILRWIAMLPGWSWHFRNRSIDQTFFESSAMLDYTVASYKHLVATDDDGLRFVNIFNWEWEIDGLWLRKGYGPDSLTPLSSDKKDRGQMLKDLGFFHEVRSVLEKMYHMAIPIPEHRLKVEWVITLYNRQMESLFAAARAKAFGLVAPSKILLWP